MKHLHIYFTVLFINLAWATSGTLTVQAETLYVSDQLTIPMRSGASNQHRIIKFLRSGTALQVLGKSDDGKYLHVQTSKGKKGWVETRQTMHEVSARERIVRLKKQFSNVSDTIADFEKKIATLKQENQLLQDRYKSLESERQNLESAYDELKLTAANPLALARTNKQLQRKLDQALASEEQLVKENQKLKDNVMQEWFMIGGGVSIGSLLLGLIITRINWRRKRNSWGDSF